MCHHINCIFVLGSISHGIKSKGHIVSLAFWVGTWGFLLHHLHPFLLCPYSLPHSCLPIWFYLMFIRSVFTIYYKCYGMLFTGEPCSILWIFFLSSIISVFFPVVNTWPGFCLFVSLLSIIIVPKEYHKFYPKNPYMWVSSSQYVKIFKIFCQLHLREIPVRPSVHWAWPCSFLGLKHRCCLGSFYIVIQGSGHLPLLLDPPLPESQTYW